MATLAKRGSGTPVTNGTTWAALTNAVDGTPPANPATYTTYTNATSAAVGYIEISGYAFATEIGASDTLNSVTVSLRHLENNTARFASVRFQPYDGATAIGTIFTATLAATARNDTTTFPVTLAQLRSSTFKIRVTITGAASTQSRVCSIDHVDVTADYTPPAPSITQAAYRFYDETGTESGSTALDAQDTAHTADLGVGTGYGLVRLRLQSTTAVAVAATDDFTLQWEKNANGTWTNVPGGAVTGFNAPSLTEGQATTNRLTGGSGSFVAGKIAEDGVVDNVGWAGNNYTELVYSLQISAATLANGDVLRFRVVRNGSTAGMTYTAVPTVNCIVPASIGLWNGLPVLEMRWGSQTVSDYQYGIATAAFVPTDLPNCVLWLDGDDDATFTVSQWNDKSAGARHVTQATVGKQPARSIAALNGRDVVVFTQGSADCMQYVAGADFITGTTLTAFIVAYLDGAPAGNDRVLGFNSVFDEDYQASGAVAAYGTGSFYPDSYRNAALSHASSVMHSQWLTITSLFDGANHTMFTGSTAYTSVASTGSFAIRQINIACNRAGTENANVRIAEIIIYSDAKNSTDRATVRSYLTTKWGV